MRIKGTDRMIPATPVPRRSRLVLAGGVAAALALLWWVTRGDDHDPQASADAHGDGAEGGAGRNAFLPIRRLADGRWGASRFAPRTGGPADGLVRVRGTVVDAHDKTPVGDVAVVFSGADGEAETTAAADGTYSIDIPAGGYHAFVRGDGVMSVGPFSMERLPGPPEAPGGAPTDALAPLITVARDESGVDLPVEQGGIVTGRVVDRAGHPIAGALVRAQGESRPVLGTDVAETDATGAYRLELPSGNYVIDAAHPDYGGLDTDSTELDLLPGTRKITLDLTMTAGCIVRGRVFGPDGKPAADGAIEGRVGDDEFHPIGRIEANGTFRFQTTATVAFELRAWPWKSPPSAGQPFRCSEGARFAADFHLGTSTPDLDGTIATADGRPAAGAYLDVMAQDGRGESQQERADASGAWAVYSMPPGDYVVTANVPGEGAVSKRVHVPTHAVALALGGTGAIAGTLKGVPDGIIAMTVSSCSGDPSPDRGGQTSRLVPVHDGQFRIDGLPACRVFISTSVGMRAVGELVEIEPGHDGVISLDLTPPRHVTVHGQVTAVDGRAAAGALVRSWSSEGSMTETTADPGGAYTIVAETGAELVASASDDVVTATVPDDAPDSLAMDLRLQPGEQDEGITVQNGADAPPDPGSGDDDEPDVPPPPTTTDPAHPTQPNDDTQDRPSDSSGVQID